MDSTNPRAADAAAPNRDQQTATNTLPTNSSTSTPQPASKPPIPPSPWAAQTTTFSATSSGSPSFPQFSAATAEILKRLQAHQGNATGTPAFEAKRAEVLQNYVTSDRLPTPPSIPASGRRGRGGKVGTPSGLKTEGTAGSAASTPASGRGSGRGRGRGRRQRCGLPLSFGPVAQQTTDPHQDDSDISSSYTPLPTRTKSGRNVNRPVAFVPTLPEPAQTSKRRRSTKTILTAQCKICHRGTDPGNNRIVFCDVCSTAYHQYCHKPPIETEVVNVLEKEWLCGPCERSKRNVIEGTKGLVAAEGLSIEDVSILRYNSITLLIPLETRILYNTASVSLGVFAPPRHHPAPRASHISTRCP